MIISDLLVGLFCAFQGFPYFESLETTVEKSSIHCIIVVLVALVVSIITNLFGSYYSIRDRCKKKKILINIMRSESHLPEIFPNPPENSANISADQSIEFSQTDLLKVTPETFPLKIQKNKVIDLFTINSRLSKSPENTAKENKRREELRILSI